MKFDAWVSVFCAGVTQNYCLVNYFVKLLFNQKSPSWSILYRGGSGYSLVILTNTTISYNLLLGSPGFGVIDGAKLVYSGKGLGLLDLMALVHVEKV